MYCRQGSEPPLCGAVVMEGCNDWGPGIRGSLLRGSPAHPRNRDEELGATRSHTRSQTWRRAVITLSCDGQDRHTYFGDGGAGFDDDHRGASPHESSGGAPRFELGTCRPQPRAGTGRNRTEVDKQECMGGSRRGLTQPRDVTGHHNLPATCPRYGSVHPPPLADHSTGRPTSVPAEPRGVLLLDRRSHPPQASAPATRPVRPAPPVRNASVSSLIAQTSSGSHGHSNASPGRRSAP